MEQAEKSPEEPLTIVKSGKYIGLGIVIGIGLLLLNLLAVNFHIGYLHNYLNGRQLLYNAFVSYPYYISLVIFILFSYYYTGKYCGKRWKKPSWEWGFWLTLPIIGFIITEYIRMSTHVYGGSSQVMAGVMLTAYIITYFVLLLVSSYGGYVGAKSVQQEEEISE